MVDTSKIPSPKHGNKVKVIKRDFNTEDIADLVLEVDGQDDKRFCDFARQFEPTERGLYKLWDFVKYKIEYRADKFGDQDVKSAASLWSMGVGDCKSKTIFVNQVLRCLGVDYTIRFTSYGGFFSRKKVTHVYSIAHLPEGDVIIDTVYHFYNKEKKYTYNKDYTMGRLASISGIGSAELLADSEVRKEFKAIKDKQSYVPKGRFLEYSKMTDGEVTAQLMFRQMQILGGMKPEQKAIMQAGEKLVDKVLMNQGKGIHGLGAASFAGIHVPKELNGVAAALKKATTKGQAALSHSRIDQGKRQTLPAPKKPGIGLANSEVFTLDDVFEVFTQGFHPPKPTYIFGSTTPYKKDYDIIMPKVCQLFKQWEAAGKLPKVYPSNPNGSPFATPQYPRKGLPRDFDSVCSALSPWRGTAGALNDLTSFQLGFISQADKEVFIRELEIASGIYDEYLNNTFVENTNGSPGTYAIYDTSYLQGVQIGGQSIALNQWPGPVVAKSIAQGQWFDGMTNFTGLSRNNVSNIARNNIIFDSSAQPEATLKNSLLWSNPNISIIPLPAIVAAITAIMAAIGSAVAGVVESVNKAEALDRLRADNANLPRNAGPGSALNEGDWPPPTGAPLQTGGGTAPSTNTGSNTGLLLGAAAAAAGLWYMNQEK